MSTRKKTLGAKSMFLFVTITMNIAATAVIAAGFMAFQLAQRIQVATAGIDTDPLRSALLPCVVAAGLSAMGAISLFIARHSMQLDYQMLNDRLDETYPMTASLATDPTLIWMVVVGNVSNIIGTIILVYITPAIIALL